MSGDAVGATVVGEKVKDVDPRVSDTGGRIAECLITVYGTYSEFVPRERKEKFFYNLLQSWIKTLPSCFDRNGEGYESINGVSIATNETTIRRQYLDLWVALTKTAVEFIEERPDDFVIVYRHEEPPGMWRHIIRKKQQGARQV